VKQNRNGDSKWIFFEWKWREDQELLVVLPL